MANINLLNEAVAVIEAVPSDQFGMDSIVTVEGDTLVGDAAYWLAQDPQFQALGLSLKRGGGIYIHGEYWGYSIAMSQLFGMSFNDAFLLFGQRREDVPASDKAVFLARLRGYIQQKKVQA